MNPQTGLCDSDLFMQVFGRYGNSQGSYFGVENDEFTPDQISMIQGPVNQGTIRCR